MVPVATGQAMLPNNATVQNVTLQPNTEGKGEMVHIVATDAQGNIVTGDAVVMTPISLTQAQNAQKNGVPLSAMEVMEQKNWWQLEEMANNLLQQAQQLKIMIDQVRQQSLVAKDTALQQQRAQLDKEKQEALNATRIEASMNLSRVIMEERAQRDIAVQQALVQARAELDQKMGSVTVISDEKVSYNVSWPATSSGMVMASEEDEEDKDGKDQL
ncbi:deformed epidermal autoregulatory factor 1-like protein [Plakobranchus ocellatus]|uniref:Deformed epidermal autoregulatory factor 1-like protein n=1 Tax=Plakobranchus ocellatus TaxID=259542 RepID=A0AAV4DF23_9GAST|nr:deformed epidermal autoregulatory factor 1-like protein [Plakobranchus ocellatus]